MIAINNGGVWYKYCEEINTIRFQKIMVAKTNTKPIKMKFIIFPYFLPKV